MTAGTRRPLLSFFEVVALDDGTRSNRREEVEPAIDDAARASVDGFGEDRDRVKAFGARQ
ncbi:hypothetical protein [Halorubellus litoreus]|uniref:Uncharacterized protein n=1 Tax=Halorubellus litoreus TaxID=755308 RepID=A0ABD5VI94_9EURY